MKIVLVTAKDVALAYVCDNAQAADVLQGPARAGTVTLHADDGATLTATIGTADAKGTVFLAGRVAVGFHAVGANGQAGLYPTSAPSAAGTLIGRRRLGPSLSFRSWPARASVTPAGTTLTSPAATSPASS
jgi:hypothetical protein